MAIKERKFRARVASLTAGGGGIVGIRRCLTSNKNELLVLTTRLVHVMDYTTSDP